MFVSFRVGGCVVLCEIMIAYTRLYDNTGMLHKDIAVYLAELHIDGYCTL